MPISHPRLAARGRVGAVAGVAGAIALLLTGCVGASEPTPTPTPTDVTIAPIFATDEEALAAAVSAYEAYLQVSADIGEDGGQDSDRVLDVVTSEYADEVVADFDAMAAQGLRVTGSNTIDTTSIVSSYQHDGTVNVVIYGCVGVGTTRVLDEDGTDLTPAERDERVPLVLSFESTGSMSRLVLSGSDAWTGDDFC